MVIVILVVSTCFLYLVRSWFSNMSFNTNNNSKIVFSEFYVCNKYNGTQCLSGYWQGKSLVSRVPGMPGMVVFSEIMLVTMKFIGWKLAEDFDDVLFPC